LIVNGEDILAQEKDVVILGGGDTGADCLGTSLRQGARSVTQLEILGKPPLERTSSMPWPQWPMILRSSTSHEEGGRREWSMLTKAFQGNAAGEVTGIQVVEIAWNETRTRFDELPGTEKVIPCGLVLLALGFTGPQRSGLLEQLGLSLDERGNVRCQRFQSSVPGVFAAGDARRGQSLVVWAIHEGREAARAIDEFLMGSSVLEARDTGILRNH
jgi:glutamate synthase (NADPH/NADH) small chain